MSLPGKVHGNGGEEHGGPPRSRTGSKDGSDQNHAYKKVRNCHLTETTSYYDFVFWKAIEHPGPEPTTIA